MKLDTNELLMFPDMETFSLPTGVAKEEYANQIMNDYLIDNDDLSHMRVEAGQTYMGQFMAHDFIPSTTFHVDRKSVTPSLNLQCLYGNAIYNKPNYSLPYFTEDGFFKIRAVACNCGKVKLNRDLIRVNNPHNEKEKIALIPDQRNDENIIISQLHVLWQRFHNVVLSRLKVDFPKADRSKLFLSTMRILQKTYHNLIKHDYLNQLMHSEVFEYYVTKKNKFKIFKNNSLTKIPLEFSQAVFRFGHSMVRHEYQINNTQFLGLKSILEKSKQNLEYKDIINWEFFFQFQRLDEDSIYHLKKEIAASVIEREIENGANHIDSLFPTELKVKINNSMVAVKFINLMAAISSPVTTYKHIYNHFKNNLFSDSELNFYDIDEKFNLDREIPLWVDILRESNEQNNLGKVGSVITTEVVLKAIENSENEFQKNDSICDVEEFVDCHIFINGPEKIRYGNLIKFIETGEENDGKL